MAYGESFRNGNLEPGMALGEFVLNVSLNADNLVVNPLRNAFIRLTSDNTTASNRTFVLTNGSVEGQLLHLKLVSAGSTTCELANTGNVALTAAWTPLLNEYLTLQWDQNAAKWVEVSRSAQDSNASITALEGDVSTLQTDVGTLQTDVGTLQTDVTTIQGELGGDGPYTPAVDADWVDPNPTTVGEALDRIAAAVEGLLSGPIP